MDIHDYLAVVWDSCGICIHTIWVCQFVYCYEMADLAEEMILKGEY